MPKKTPEDIIFEYPGTFSQLVDPSTNFYEELGEKNTFVIQFVKRAALQYFIVILEVDEEVFRLPISQNTFIQYSMPTVSLHWAALVEGNVETFGFQMRFEGGKESIKEVQARISQLVTLFNQATYSLFIGKDKVTEDDEDFEYLKDTYSAGMPQEGEEEPVYNFIPEKISVSDTGKGNVCFSDACKWNLSLVVKDSDAKGLSIQAHRYDENGFVGEENGVQSLLVKESDKVTGALLDPSERNMLTFGGKRAALQHIDLERATVVQEYCAPEERKVLYATYAHHSSSHDPTLITCLTPHAAFSIDTRMDAKKCAIYENDKTITDYELKAKSSFTCHATSANGYLAIGDEVGAIRLYSGPPGSKRPNENKYFPKSAKTLLDVKQPILHMDLSESGKYLLVTCRKYVLFIETEYKHNNELCTGFVQRMGANKPTPLRLMPSYDQLVAIGGAENVSFTQATFDYNSDEDCIIACCGNYLLTWSLRNVIRCQERNETPISVSTAVGSNALASIRQKQQKKVSFLLDDEVGQIEMEKSTWKGNGIRFNKKK